MFHYYMFNKPYGCVSARSDDTHPTVMDYFKELNNNQLSPVGRLDLATEGLLFITDDGVWNQTMTHPSHQKEKTYEFIALGNPSADQLHHLETGLLLTGASSLTAPAKILITKKDLLKNVLPDLHPEICEKTKHNRPEHPVIFGTITVTEGKKHQVRRMLKCIGCCIIYLKRISMGNYTLDTSLKPGEWKEINPKN